MPNHNWAQTSAAYRQELKELSRKVAHGLASETLEAHTPKAVRKLKIVSAGVSRPFPQFFGSLDRRAERSPVMLALVSAARSPCELRAFASAT